MGDGNESAITIPVNESARAAHFQALIVDDEALVGGSLALTEEGHAVCEMGVGASAGLALSEGDRFDVEGLDYRLADSDDLNRLLKVRTAAPAVRNARHGERRSQRRFVSCRSHLKFTRWPSLSNRRIARVITFGRRPLRPMSQPSLHPVDCPDRVAACKEA